MTQMEDAIAQTVVSMWDLLLEVPLQISEDQQGDTGAERVLTGCIHVTGVDGGVMTLETSEHLARDAAATLFQLPTSRVALEDAQDALAELANIMAGNFKALVGAGHQLSLPTVVEGRDFRTRFLGTRRTARVAFDAPSGRLIASFYKDAHRDATRARAGAATASASADPSTPSE